MKKRRQLIFIVLCVACCIFPLVTFPAAGNQEAESEDAEVEWPAFFDEDGAWNSAFLEEAGDYFSYKFGFRQQYVTVNSAVKGTVFHTSGSDNVLKGQDGWLYYETTVDDFLGNETLSDLQLAEIVSNLELVQTTLADVYGIDFVFTISPNKNSLYPEHMPALYEANAETRNSTRLRAMLAESEVAYVDLYALFESQDEVLYHRTDSHWNNRGAALVNTALMTALGRDSYDYSSCGSYTETDFLGDLLKQVYPTVEGSAAESLFYEEEIYYEKERTYTTVDEIESNYDPEIETVNDEGTGSVVMFRDSFGNSLLPFVADEFAEGFFSRANPFTVYEAVDRQADTVIAEIVERDLDLLQEAAPVLAVQDVVSDFYAQDIYMPDAFETGVYATAAAGEYPAGNSVYLKITGELDPDVLTADSVTYISIYNEETYDWYVYPVYYAAESATDEERAAYGYTAYFEQGDLYAAGIYEVSVLIQNGEETVRSENLTQIVIDE